MIKIKYMSTMLKSVQESNLTILNHQERNKFNKNIKLDMKKTKMAFKKMERKFIITSSQLKSKKDK